MLVFIHSSENTWEPETNLNCPDLIKTFVEKKKSKSDYAKEYWAKKKEEKKKSRSGYFYWTKKKEKKESKLATVISNQVMHLLNIIHLTIIAGVLT